MYRISQVQEPYTAVTYLSERIPIVNILNLTHPDQGEPGFFWSGWTVCEAFALQRGFLTPKAARPDVYRAANLILRMANDGRLLLIFRPLGFFRLQHEAPHVSVPLDPVKSIKSEESVTESSSVDDFSVSRGFSILADFEQDD